MATYNGARYIREQLDSLAAQTLLPCELVVTDDGSTDATLEIVRDFARDAPFPVRIYCNKLRLGFGDNFLYAASLCEGVFIAFCDQDDVWMKDKLAVCAEKFIDQMVLLVMHSAHVVKANLEATEEFYPNITKSRIYLPLSGSTWQNTPGFSMVFRASLLGLTAFQKRPNNIYADPNKQLMMAHDQWVYFLAQSIGKIIWVPESLALYRTHSANTCGPSKSTSWRDKVSLSVSTQAAHYVYLSTIAGQYADVMASLETRQEIPYDITARARSARDHWHTVKCNLLRRAAIYGNLPLNVRLRNFNHLLANGAYCRRKYGGFGLRGFAKDITIGIFGQRRSRESGTEAESMGDSS
jgi:glycosyltransferase involved in cell wall biosynthesis